MMSKKKLATLALLLIAICLVYFLPQFPSEESVTLESAASLVRKAPYPVLDDANFWEMIDEALKADDVQEIKRLTDGVGFEVSKSDGSNLLHHAVFEEASQVVELLLERGLDPSVAAAEGSTPLMHVALIGNVDLARVLIDKGAVVNYFNDSSLSPLMVACLQANPSIDLVVFLFENGADINAVSPEDASMMPNATALEVAIAMDNIQAFDALLELGADVRVSLPQGQWTVMKWADFRNKTANDDSYLKLLEAHLGSERFREKMSLESSVWNTAN